MRCVWLVWLLTMAGTITVSGQSTSPVPPPPPQSARQALIEMFVGKGVDDFVKHLPDAARGSLIHKGETPESSIALRISTIGRQITMQGEHVETFDAGPNILVSDNAGGHEKIEVAVEHDSLMGEEDEIELSVHVYKDGQQQSLPVVPRLTFTLKQENEVWRLTEVTIAAHVPLTDPDYLKGLRHEQDETNESAAQGRMTMIGQAETQFAASHPDRGYACTLSDLFPAPNGSVEGTTYNPGFANEEANGYRFVLTACEGSPASKYRLTAVPVDPDSEMKVFCVDQSGTLKSSVGGKQSNCFSRGEFVNSIQAPNPSVE